MKRFIYVILSIFFFLLGIIGLALPVIPQVPFFVLGLAFLAGASRRVHNRIISTSFYQKHGEQFIEKHKLLRKLLTEDETKDEESQK